MSINFLKSFRPLLIIYLLSTAIFIIGRNILNKYQTDSNVLIFGNTILFITVLLSFYLYRKSFQYNSPRIFLRYIYSGMFLKMLICIITAFIYIAIAGNQVNKPALFGCMFLYFLYTFIEISILLKLSKQQKNVETRGSA